MPWEPSSDNDLREGNASAEPSLPASGTNENRRIASASAMRPPAPRRKSARNAVQDGDGTAGMLQATVDYELVRRRAYELWEQRGRIDGMPEEDWLRAEAELRHEPEQPSRPS